MKGLPLAESKVGGEQSVQGAADPAPLAKFPLNPPTPREAGQVRLLRVYSAGELQ